jgi:hypothetical protein
MKINFHHRFLSFILIASGLISIETATARPYSAKREFFHLKASAEFFNYVENQSYVELVGTKFIGLQSASDENRTCLYGLSQAGLEGPGTFQVQTRFVCFNSDQYQLSMKKEWCELGSPGCEIDPGGISVGIGNLNVAEPIVTDDGLPWPKPGSFYDSYPKILNVDVHKPSLFH